MIAPPYSSEFIQVFLPIVRNEKITGRLRNADQTDDVSLFLGEFFVRQWSRRRGAHDNQKHGFVLFCFVCKPAIDRSLNKNVAN